MLILWVWRGAELGRIIYRSGILTIARWLCTWLLLCVLFLPVYFYVAGTWFFEPDTWVSARAAVRLVGFAAVVLIAGWLAWLEERRAGRTGRS